MLNLHKLTNDKYTIEQIEYLLLCDNYTQYSIWKIYYFENKKIEKENMYWPLNFDKGCILEVIAQILGVNVVYGDVKFLDKQGYTIKLYRDTLTCVDSSNMFSLPKSLLKGIVSSFNKTYTETQDYILIDEKYQSALLNRFRLVSNATLHLSLGLKLRYDRYSDKYYVY